MPSDIIEYNANGCETYAKKAGGVEYWYEYDERGNKIYERNSADFECWPEYEFWGNGKLKKCVTYWAV